MENYHIHIDQMQIKNALMEGNVAAAGILIGMLASNVTTQSEFLNVDIDMLISFASGSCTVFGVRMLDITASLDTFIISNVIIMVNG